MAIKSVYILNRAGGLIFQRDFSEELNKLDANDYLVLAGTLHSVHALSSRISPTHHSSGFRTVEMESAALHCFQSLTGVKIIVISDRWQRNISEIIKSLNCLYADYVMKNPFYTMDMPIRCSKFESHLASYVSTIA